MRPSMLFAALLTGCTFAHHPEVPAQASAAPAPTWDQLLAGPGVIEHEAALSARWAVPLAGLVNLEHPDAAQLQNGSTPMVLPVHVLRHPQHGTWIVDTGVPAGLHDKGLLRGLVRGALSDIEVIEPLADILARQPKPLAGVLITHMHIDHVLGLPDVPAATPVYVGPGEQSPRSLENGLLRPTYGRLLDGQEPLRVWQYAAAPAPLSGAVDVLGDGSLWALETPGHTPGSASYLALTTDGPVLFTGDTCHTLWGWEHGVEPGEFTLDHEANARSLASLRALVDAHPQIRVYVGHELDGEGTGVNATIRRK